jgi:hypothetical protein
VPLCLNAESKALICDVMHFGRAPHATVFSVHPHRMRRSLHHTFQPHTRVSLHCTNFLTHTQAVNKLLNFIQDQIDRYYDRFELFCLSNVLRVPPHVHLSTDLPSGDATVTPERVAELRSEQQALMEKLHAAMATREAQERELADLRTRKASEGPAIDMTREVTAACKRSGVSGSAEYVTMITADIEAVTRYCEESTKNAREVLRVTAAEEPGRAFKRRRAEVESSALADVANSFRRK